ncbi:MAG: ABC transporter ATP-binding protein [Myxococcales bacterium]|nr:ABC transporter ATP-binding protein [Myxococcales bacterium]
MSGETKSQLPKPGRGIHWTRIRAFLSGYSLVFGEATSDQRGRVLLVVVLSGLGATLQGASLGLLGFFVNRMTDPRSVELPFGTFVIGENAPSIVLLSASVFALMVATAGATYGAARLARAVGRRFQRRASRSILESLGRLGGRDRRPAMSRDDAALLAIRTTRNLGRAIQNTLQALPGLAQLIVALGIAVHLDARLTLGLAPLALVLLPALYVFSGSVQRNSKAFYDEGIGQMARRVRQLVAAIDASRVGHASGQVGGRLYDEDPQIGRYLDLFDGQQLAVRRSNFITSVFRACSILLLLAIAGYNALKDAFSWGELVAYVGALGYVLNNVQMLAGVFTQLNRFYPHVQKFVAWRDMVAGAGSTEIAAPRGPAGDLILKIPDDAAASAGETVVVKPGGALTCWTPLVLGRLSFWEVVRPLVRAGSLPVETWGRAEFVGDGEFLGTASLERHVFGDAPPPGGSAVLAGWLAALGVSEEIVAWPGGTAAPIDAARFSAASRELRAAIRLLPLVASQAPLVILTGSTLAQTSESFRRALLALFDDRVLIVLCRSVTLPVPEIGTVVVSDGTRIVGAGSPRWFEEFPLVTRMASGGDVAVLEEDDDDDGDV